jgi:hypothetical protein
MTGTTTTAFQRRAVAPLEPTVTRHSGNFRDAVFFAVRQSKRPRTAAYRRSNLHKLDTVTSLRGQYKGTDACTVASWYDEGS